MTNPDPWTAWRTLGGWPGAVPTPWASASAGAQASLGAPSNDLLERFDRAAQAYLAAAATPNADAARTFGDALRELFAALQPPFGQPAVNGGGQNTPPIIPALGLAREHQLRWQRLLAAAGQREEAQRRLQHLWLDALRDAAAAFVAALGRQSTTAGTPAADAITETTRRLYDTWIDCAEEAYARIAHGPAFCGALADAVNAGSRWRQELKALVEESSKFLDLPTRSELNSLHERLRALEAQLPAAPRSRRPRKKS